MIRIVYYLLVLAFFNSCAMSAEVRYRNFEFKKVSEAQFVMLTDELLVQGCNDIEFYREKIIMATNIDDKMIHIYDATSGDYVKGMLNFGRGNNEVSTLFQLDFNRLTSELLIFDNASLKSYFLNIDSALNGKDIVVASDINVKRGVDGLFYGGCDETFLTRGKKPRFLKLMGTDTLSCYDTYPLEYSSEVMEIYSESRLTMSSDRKKMAVGTCSCAILELFFIEKEITNNHVHYLVNGTMMDTFGFMDMYGTNKYIYTSYAGYAKEQNPEYKDIAILDWEGNPVRLIRTDCNIVRLCVNDDETKLYAFVQADDGKLYIGYITL